MQILVTGGAGFMGSNLVVRLIGDGHICVVFDNLSRPGAQANLEWIRTQGSGRVAFIPGDVRDAAAVEAATRDVDTVYHLAAQTAVTTSVLEPRRDFEINAVGTLNILEAARRSPLRPRVIFASTNKVYGALNDLKIIEGSTRYTLGRNAGVSEDHAIEFHSPYACSKGAADQYVQDYGRIYGLRTAVLRLSCVYGPRQFGTEDQGWVAHFVIAGAMGRPLTIYGNGKQLRDVLFIDDLVELYARFLDTDSSEVWGAAYNVGGGSAFTLSLVELLDLLKPSLRRSPQVVFEDWRPADQRVYVSDTSRIRRALGWEPRIAPPEGVRRLLHWVQAHQELFASPARG